MQSADQDESTEVQGMDVSTTRARAKIIQSPFRPDVDAISEFMHLSMTAMTTRIIDRVLKVEKAYVRKLMVLISRLIVVVLFVRKPVQL